MRSALTVAVAALLAFSLVPMAIAASGTPAPELSVDSSQESSSLTDSVDPQTTGQVDTNGTTTRLGLSGQAESGYVESGPDLGTTLASNADELRSEWQFHALEYRWSDLNRSERAAGIETAQQRIGDRIERLDTREQAVASAVAAGDAPPSRLLRTLARNDHEVSVLKRQLGRLTMLADDVPYYTFIDRPTVGSLNTHEGPVRNRVYRTISASDPGSSTDTVLVEATDSGVLVSTTTAGTYLREATRYDYRDQSLPSQYPERTAGGERLSELYPWVHGDGATGQTSLSQYRPIHQFSFETPHRQGILTAHLDSGTTEVFRENQELRVGDLPRDTAGTWEAGSATVSLDVTPRSGPVRFNVTETETGDPVDATILVDGEPIAETDTDGTVWVTRPVTSTEVTVQTPDGSTAIQLSG